MLLVGEITEVRRLRLDERAVHRDRARRDDVPDAGLRGAAGHGGDGDLAFVVVGHLQEHTVPRSTEPPRRVGDGLHDAVGVELRHERPTYVTQNLRERQHLAELLVVRPFGSHVERDADHSRHGAHIVEDRRADRVHLDDAVVRPEHREVAFPTAAVHDVGADARPELGLQRLDHQARRVVADQFFRRATVEVPAIWIGVRDDTLEVDDQDCGVDAVEDLGSEIDQPSSRRTLQRRHAVSKPCVRRGGHRGVSPGRERFGQPSSVRPDGGPNRPSG